MASGLLRNSRSVFPLEWKGGSDGALRRFKVVFVKRMKPEGITGGMIGSRDTLVIVDEGGGFQVI